MAAGFVEPFPSPGSGVMGSSCAPLTKFSDHEIAHIPPLPVDEYQSYMHLSPDSRKGILKQGWLHKLSYHGRGWKKRYVVITEDCELQYWSHVFPFNGGTAQWELKGIVSLDDAEFAKVQNLLVDGHEGRFPVAIKISSQRSVSPKHSQWWILRDYFFAADENELEPWLRELGEVKFKCEVELVDRAYCLTSSIDASESPRSKLESEYMFVEPRILLPLSRQLVLNTHNNMANATRKVAETVHTFFRNIVDGPPPELDRRQFLDGSCAPAWVLGWKYKVGPDSPRGNTTNRGTADQQTVWMRAQRAFKHDIQSRLWFTYRSGFSPIEPSNLTSDSGWGCMLRSGQMMLAQALLHHHLRRDWRLRRDKPTPRWYGQILKLFEDHPASMFSIHRIAQTGQQFHRNIGQWFGPDTICRVLRHIWNMNESAWPCHTAGMLFVEDHCIYRDLAENVACSRQAYSGTNCSRMAQAREPCQWRPLIVVVPVRLGASDRINPSYIPKLASYLSLPQSLGFIGGRPRHSYYFVGVRGYNAYYLDPHVTQPYQSIRKNINVASFHCAHPGKMSLAHIDPSLALGFYCDDKSDFEDLLRRVEELASGDSHPILSVGNRAPDYLSLDDVDEDVVTFEDVN
mmetsp:Transcript_30173/g.68267  ORF Transcript_30173/g.68267 Transcript_30173/m.68267 type:complete len:628 (-) Transcript_30173:86-1969(-)